MTDVDRRAAVIPLDFRIEYLPQADGSMREIEVVEYTRKGSQGATTPARIEHLKRTRPGQPLDPVWLAIKPYYEGWKEGRETPVDGTPLAAWPGATPQLVKALEPFHLRSVEDLAEMNDDAMSRVPVPGIRSIRQNARAFVDVQKSTAPMAGKLSELQTENADLRRELDELKGLVKSLAAAKGVTMIDGDAGVEPALAKRGPGRPRKDEAA